MKRFFLNLSRKFESDPSLYSESFLPISFALEKENTLVIKCT